MPRCMKPSGSGRARLRGRRGAQAGGDIIGCMGGSFQAAFRLKGFGSRNFAFLCVLRVHKPVPSEGLPYCNRVCVRNGLPRPRPLGVSARVGGIAAQSLKLIYRRCKAGKRSYFATVPRAHPICRPPVRSHGTAASRRRRRRHNLSLVPCPADGRGKVCVAS